MLLISSVGHW